MAHVENKNLFYYYRNMVHPLKQFTGLLKLEKLCNNKELLDKCERGNKIAPLWHKCRGKWGINAKAVQFYCPSSIYPAIVLLVLYLLLNYRAIFDTSVERGEAHMLKGCIKNYSIVKLNNKVGTNNE